LHLNKNDDSLNDDIFDNDQFIINNKSDFYDIFDDDQDTNEESVGQEYNDNDNNQNMNEESVRREYDGNEK